MHVDDTWDSIVECTREKYHPPDFVTAPQSIITGATHFYCHSYFEEKEYWHPMDENSDLQILFSTQIKPSEKYSLHTNYTQRIPLG